MHRQRLHLANATEASLQRQSALHTKRVHQIDVDLRSLEKFESEKSKSGKEKLVTIFDLISPINLVLHIFRTHVSELRQVVLVFLNLILLPAPLQLDQICLQPKNPEVFSCCFDFSSQPSVPLHGSLQPHHPQLHSRPGCPTHFRSAKIWKQPDSDNTASRRPSGQMSKRSCTGSWQNSVTQNSSLKRWN